MNIFHSLTAFFVLQAIAPTVKAQTGADYLRTYNKTTCTVPFDIKAEGQPFRVAWGMDTAWDWDRNVNIGVAYIGKGNFETGRVSFQPNELVTTKGDGTYELTSKQKTALNSRISHIKLTGVTQANINCDHEALNDNNGFANYVGKPIEWYKLIKASVQYCESKGLHIISISPFNEPDLAAWGEGSKEDFLNICKLIRQDPYFDNIRLCGGNTLNCDMAMEWYSYLKEYLDEGNTHQLAGSLRNYANFFSTVTADGKYATGDELHNVGEAIVGVNYGMTSGIWWGFDARARGQFCLDSNQGVRLGYAEDENTWTSAAVYRNDQTNETHAYIGSSERQASNATYNFVSTTEDVYFNGFGPCRQYVFDIPGGTGYQIGQINAEKIIDITYGDDVPQESIDGTYCIMNYNNKMLLAVPSNTTATTNAQCITRKTSATATQQQWVVTPYIDAGDCSYYTITLNTGKNMQLDVLDWNLNSGAKAIIYKNDKPGTNEQWYLKYAGEGYWYIVSRYSNKALYSAYTASGSVVTLGEVPTNETDKDMKKRYMWRFQKLDALCNTNKPNWTDAQLTATPFAASIRLNWNVIDDENVTYNVLRAKKSDNKFNTIARSITGGTFLDNTAIGTTEYIYKIVPVAYNGTRGDASETVEASATGNKALIMQLQFDGDISDNTINKFDAAIYGEQSYTSLDILKKSGTKAFKASDLKSFLQVPYSVANLDSMTIACWVRWNGKNKWERIFDFGNGTNNYMFFTPSNGTQMRFVMKNGGDEQILTSGSQVRAATWQHVAITINPLDNGYVEAKIYINGEEVASSNTFTIKPSDIAPVLNYIGRSQFNSDAIFSGTLDDFRIYNYALSPEEIVEIQTDLEAQSKFLDDDSTDIPNVADNDGSTRIATGYYTTNGLKTSAPQRGVNIVKYSDGTTKKIIK